MTSPELIEPTQWGDERAAQMRAVFEAHRPRWWQFWRRNWNRDPRTADNLMIALLNVALTKGKANDCEGGEA